MIVRVKSTYVEGIEALSVCVEVDAALGLPGFSIVGLPDAACRESQVRVRSAIKNSGLTYPSKKKIAVNLAPACVRKVGSAFDLAMAMGLLTISGEISSEALDKITFAGELSLNGDVRPIPGILPRAVAAAQSGDCLMIPEANEAEASAVPGAKLCVVKNLKHAVECLLSANLVLSKKPNARVRTARPPIFDYAHVRGQSLAKRAIEIACAGGHNALLMGPPGSGKTLIAKCVPGILPDLEFEEALETTKIHSVAGRLAAYEGLITRPPFRDPHHSISDVALVGGGSYPKPGEISLAHRGVLFMDELPEFRRNVLEVLRQPLEDKRIIISRAAQSIAFPANFLMIAAMNPCPCGYRTDDRRECICSPIQIKNYLHKISGPLLDRIDIHMEVRPVAVGDLESNATAESSTEIRKRVVAVRQLQRSRYKGTGFALNAQLDGRDIEKHCSLTPDAREFMKSALERLGLSARAYHKVLKIARTIADLEKSEILERNHVSEAAQYRTLDKSYLII